MDLQWASLSQDHHNVFELAVAYAFSKYEGVPISWF